jgi:hypothetical protein
VRGVEQDATGQSDYPLITNFVLVDKVIEPVIAVQDWVGRKTDQIALCITFGAALRALSAAIERVHRRLCPGDVRMLH